MSKFDNQNNDNYNIIIEGLEFEYTKLEREVGSFQVTFKFNNIDFELMEQ